MASEIRVNKIENRSGLGTVTFADTGVDLAGIVTATTFSGSGASLTNLPAANVTGTLPAISGANLTNLPAANLTGTLPAISGANLTGIAATDNVRTGILDVAGVSTFRNTMNVGAAVTISESGIEASGIGITCANINGTQIGGRRNLIINGAMQVAQRGTSSTSSGYQALDRFPVYLNGADENPTHAQVSVDSGTTPYTLGFRTALKITNGNQTGGAGSNDYVWIQQKIEAQNISQSGWNYTSASSYITLSFWVRSSVAQTFKGYIETIDGTAMQYPFETGSLSANTWTKITKTIPGHANLSFDTNNGEGFKFSVIPMMGTDKTSSSVTEDAWGTYSSSARIKDVTTTWWTTNDSTFELTGVQLEVGPQATPFEFRSYGEELALCQRYYYVSGTPSGGGGLFMYDSGQTSVSYGSLRFTQTMRATPTVVLRDNNGNTDGKATQHGAAHDIAATAADINTNGFSKVNKNSGNWTTGAGCPIICGCTAAAEL